MPRGEHEEKWRSQLARDTDFQRQIDELRRSFGDTYSLKDALRAIQERLDRIETRGREGCRAGLASPQRSFQPAGQYPFCSASTTRRTTASVAAITTGHMRPGMVRLASNRQASIETTRTTLSKRELRIRPTAS